MKLTGKQKRFADEFLIDLNASAAMLRAGYKSKNPDVDGHRLLVKPSIQEYIQQRQKDREKRTEITQDMVLQRWWAIATADPNELIYHRRVCCRHCFGIDHEYQWVDEDEFDRAVMVAKASEGKIAPPSNSGGFGFDPTIRPHPKCPNCHGEGHGEIQAADTRDLSSQGKMLYAGVKTTQGGFEIKMQDQGKALENVARHLGMFNDSLKLKGDQENPLQVVFNIPRPPARPPE